MAMNYGFKAQGDRDVYCMFSFAPQSKSKSKWGSLYLGTMLTFLVFLVCQPTPKNFFSNLLTFDLMLSPSQYFRYTLYGSRMQE